MRQNRQSGSRGPSCGCGRSTSSTTQSVCCSRSNDAQADIRRTRRRTSGSRSMKMPDASSAAARPDRCRERGRELHQQRCDEVGEHQVEGTPARGHGGTHGHRARAAPTRRASRLRRALATRRLDRDGIGVHAQHGPRAERGRRRWPGCPSRCPRRGPGRHRRCPRRPSARCPRGTAASWDGDRCRRPCPGRAPGPRRPAGRGGAARSAG